MPQRSKADYEKIGVKIPLINLQVRTPKAFGFKFGPDPAERKSKVDLWLPLSQMTDLIEDKNKQTVFFAVPRWLFVENDLEDFHDEDYVDIEAV